MRWYFSYDVINQNDQKVGGKVASVVFGGHPEMETSASHQFLYASRPESVPFIQIERPFTDENIHQYQAAILSADRWFIQFPLFWYQAPGLVSDFIQEVFSKDFLDQNTKLLKDKEFGAIISVGVPLRQYQAGGREDVTISELLRPFQSFARAIGFKYLPPFVLAQHSYQPEHVQQENLVQFRQYLQLPTQANFAKRNAWLIESLHEISSEFDQPLKDQLNLVADEWSDAMDNLADIEAQLPKTTWR